MEVNYATALANLLKNTEFPTRKDRIVELLLKARSLPRTQVNETLSLVQQIEEKKYKNVAEVVRAMALVKDITNK